MWVVMKSEIRAKDGFRDRGRNAPAKYCSKEEGGVLDRGTMKERPVLTERQKLIGEPGWKRGLKGRKAERKRRLEDLGKEAYMNKVLSGRGAPMPLIEGTLSCQDRAYARMMACGMSREKAREATGLSDYRCGQLRWDPVWNALLQEERNKFAERCAAMMVENSVRGRVSMSAQKAVDRLDDVLGRDGEKSDFNAIKAADVVLKHALPKEEGKGGVGGGVIINISSEKNDMLSAIEAEIVPSGTLTGGELDGGEEGEGEFGVAGVEGESGWDDGVAESGIEQSRIREPRF